MKSYHIHHDHTKDGGKCIEYKPDPYLAYITELKRFMRYYEYWSPKGVDHTGKPLNPKLTVEYIRTRHELDIFTKGRQEEG